MDFDTMEELEKHIMEQLTQYRESRRLVEKRLSEVREQDRSGQLLKRRSELRAWVRAIRRVQVRLERTKPELARFMDVYFGCSRPLRPHYSRTRRVLDAMERFHISETTVYQWRKQVVLFTAAEALQRGLVRLRGE